MINCCILVLVLVLLPPHVSFPDRSHEKRHQAQQASSLRAFALKVHEQGTVRIASLSSLIVDDLGILFEIASVAWVNTWWNDRCANGLVQQALPIHAPEPFMVLDVIRSTLLSLGQKEAKEVEEKCETGRKNANNRDPIAPNSQHKSPTA